MVEFERHVLANGLKVLIHQDPTTPLAALNLLYDVGARDENPKRTGLAHLFEHLMFEGSVHVSNYDNELEMAGGQNNAFTNNDFTNYYLTLPRQNLETALWLESDRMLELAFSEQKLQLQKKVVAEEFKQSYLNQPYGDVWVLLRSLVYKVHPYQWPTIGKSIKHVQQVTLQEVKDFFYRYYRPNNAILVLSGDLQVPHTLELVQKWFTDIPSANGHSRDLPAEPSQLKPRRLTVERDVPFDEIYMAFPTGRRLDPSFYTTDLITDVLASGQSARLRENLVKKRRIFSQANAWITASIDKGFLVVTGRLQKGQSMEKAEELIWEELEDLKHNLIETSELQKVLNKMEAHHTFAETGILSKSMNLAYYELLGDAKMLNEQVPHYLTISAEDIRQTAQQVFVPNQMSVLYYRAQK